MTKDLYLDIDVVRDASGELRANVDFSRYVGHVRAELLKKIDAAILDSVEPQLNALGWVKERTCTMEYQTGVDNPKRGWFECSECGGLSDSVGSGWNGKKKRVNPPKFCAICGAKVVNE